MTGTEPPPAHLTAVVCRDCCCGSSAKHPDAAHDEHLDRIRSACEDHPRGRVVVSRCLGRCTSSNVVVVRTRRLGHPRSEVWLGGVLSDAAVGALVGWIRDGGEPEQLPDELVEHCLGPRHRSRRTVPVVVDGPDRIRGGTRRQG